MNRKLLLIFKSTFVPALVAMVLTCNATVFTATTSGNFSNSATWAGGIIPDSNIVIGDNIVINSGVTVTLDNKLTVNHNLATLTVNGTLQGTKSVYLTSGTLTGSGTLNLHTLTFGTTALSNFTGNITVDNLYNSQAALQLDGQVMINDTLGLKAGTVQLGNGVIVTMAANATIMLAGGQYDLGINGGINLLGGANLYYATLGFTDMGIETSLSPLNNITIAQNSSVDLLRMNKDLTVEGQLYVKTGIFYLNGYDLTLNGTVKTDSTGAFKGQGSSAVNINGTGNVGTLSFLSDSSQNNTVRQLNLNIAGSGSVVLASDIIVATGITITQGSLIFRDHDITVVNGIAGAGYLVPNENSELTVTGPGNLGKLNFKGPSTGAIIGNLRIMASGNGRAKLGSDIKITGIFNLAGGGMDMNGYDISLYGTLDSAGGGYLIADTASNITIAGNNNMGVLMFDADSNNVLHNITVSGGNNSYITLGNTVYITDSLSLINGHIIVGDSTELVVMGADSIYGGSASSFIKTTGSGSLVVNIADGSNTDHQRMVPVGTLTNFAPVRITNNSTSSGFFSVNAHPGIFENGTSGNDLSLTQTSVATSWNVESDITANPNIDMEVYWNPAMEVNQFNRADVYLSHYRNGAWDSIGGVQASLHANSWASVKRTGITTFSPFAVFSNAAPTAINETGKDISFAVFPNPATSQLTVSVANPDEYHELKVTDMQGNTVAGYNLNTYNNTLDITTLTPGIYFLTLNNSFTKRIIKK